MRSLETLIPPPAVTLVVGGLMWAAARLAPMLTARLAYRGALGAAIGVAGASLEVLAALTFRRACTTVNPLHPADATSLVTRGVYRFTRNPIYLGDLLLLVGWAVFLGNGAALALTAVFVAYIDRFQIRPEERVLADKFGRPYDDYRGRVRRWI